MWKMGQIMTFDPRAHGARCDSCPRKSQKPVPPDGPRGAKICFLGQDPGKNEVRKGRGFVGKTGQLLFNLWANACSRQGVKAPRSKIWVTNTALCRPITKSAKEASAARDCCRPRLLKELEALHPAAGILAMGKLAWETLTGQTSGVKSHLGFHVRLSRGAIQEGAADLRGSQRLWFEPVVHPASTFRQPAALGPLAAHIDGFVQRLKDGLPPPPVLIDNATAVQLRRLVDMCKAAHVGLAVDVETMPPKKGRDAWAKLPRFAELRAFGVGAAIGKRGIGYSWFFPAPPNVWAEFKRAMADEKLIKVGMNLWHFDKPLLERYGVTIK